MPAFTLWSKDKLIGRAKIMYFPPFPGMRVGDFDATEVGEQLMSVMLCVRPAVTAFYEFREKARREAAAAGVDVSKDDWRNCVRTSTEYADMVSSQHEFDRLELQLRDSGGRVVPTEWIDMRDAEKMTAEAHEFMLAEAESMGIELDFDELEPWEPKPSKYQIQIMLEGGEELWRTASRKRRQEAEADLDEV